MNTFVSRRKNKRFCMRFMFCQQRNIHIHIRTQNDDLVKFDPYLVLLKFVSGIWTSFKSVMNSLDRRQGCRIAGLFMSFDFDEKTYCAQQVKSDPCSFLFRPFLVLVLWLQTLSKRSISFCALRRHQKRRASKKKITKTDKHSHTNQRDTEHVI